jgi:hypothetical protein
MTNGLTVAPNERHVVRVFALDISDDEAARLRAGAGRDRAMGALLGVGRLDPGHVEIIDTADLAGVGLAQFLIDGHGAAEAPIAADRGKLDALDGPVMVVTSGAFDPAGATLHPTADARLIGTYREEVPEVHFEPLPDAGAKGTLTPPPPAAAAPGGMGRGVYIALAVAVVVILLLLLSLLSG